MSDSTCKTRPDLEYPCPWAYRVIGRDEAALRAAITGLMGRRDHTLAVSNRSARGKYVSLLLEVTVRDEGDRLSLFADLSSHAAVKIVL